jgi:hypothetical protein
MGIIDKPGVNIDARFRSLLQKAVRRGNLDLVLTTSAMIQALGTREKSWYRNRAVVIAFEECWPLGQELVFNRHFHSKVALLVKVAQALKFKDATGLGYLAYSLYEGDRSVLEGNREDRHIRIVAHGLHRPDDYWQWLDRNIEGPAARSLIENAHRYRQAGLPRDRAVIQAAAYLAASGDVPKCSSRAPAEASFPYWIALDMHTPQGKRVLKDVSRDLHIPRKQLEWAFFYFEGAASGQSAPAYWWDRRCRWYFRRIGLPVDEAHLLWEPAKPQMEEALAEDSRRLHREIYTWKLENREKIETLQMQVALFRENYESGSLDQMELF